MNNSKKKKDRGQEIQDALFRAMSADERMDVGVGLWRLGRELAPQKTYYGTDRSETTPNRYHGHS